MSRREAGGEGVGAELGVRAASELWEEGGGGARGGEGGGEGEGHAG